MKESYECEVGAAMLADVPAGEKSRRWRVLSATVVISSDGKDDQPVESLEVKVTVGWEKYPVRSARVASNLAGRSE
jgi:hypothetical protein